MPDFFQEATGERPAAPVRQTLAVPPPAGPPASKKGRARGPFEHLVLKRPRTANAGAPMTAEPDTPPLRQETAVAQDRVWAELGALQPVAGKRLTVHRADCACFLCSRKRRAALPESSEGARERGEPGNDEQVRLHDCW